MKLLFLCELISRADFPVVLEELIVSCVFPKQNLVKWPGNTSQIIPPLLRAVLQGDAVEFLFSWWSFNHSFFSNMQHSKGQMPGSVRSQQSLFLQQLHCKSQPLFRWQNWGEPTVLSFARLCTSSLQKTWKSSKEKRQEYSAQGLVGCFHCSVQKNMFS